ncbi:MAG: porin [Burkholderiales bacterium]|nr:porin [Burkholderiales bacterium]
MNKKLPFAAALCACAFATAHAQSSVTLYGFIDSGIVSASNVYDKATGTSGTMLALGDGISWGTSRFGLKGREDLGGGLSAIYTLESGFDVPNGRFAGTGIFNRGAFVGLQSERLGTLTIGRQWNLSDGTMVGPFFRGGYNLSVFRLTGFDEVSDLVDNAVKYQSPDWAGLRASGLYGFGNVPGSVASNSVYEAALSYASGPLNLGAVYHHRHDALAPFSSELWELGANYSFGRVRVRLGFGNSGYPDANGAALHAAVYDLGMDYYATGALTLSADAIYRKQFGTDDSAVAGRFTADYSLSKQTGIFANLGLLKNRHNSAESFYGDGLAGQSQVVANIGIRHAF